MHDDNQQSPGVSLGETSKRKAEDSGSNAESPNKRARLDDGKEKGDANAAAPAEPVNQKQDEQMRSRLPRLSYVYVETRPLSTLRDWRESLPFDVALRNRSLPKGVDAVRDRYTPVTGEGKAALAMSNGSAENKSADRNQVPETRRKIRLSDTFRAKEGMDTALFVLCSQCLCVLHCRSPYRRGFGGVAIFPLRRQDEPLSPLLSEASTRVLARPGQRQG